MRDPQPNQKSPPQAPQDVPAAEWVVAALGLVIVSAALVTLLFKAPSQAAAAPEIRISVILVEPQERGHLVRIRIANTGALTASQLVLEGTLKGAADETERRQITIDYVPPRSERTAGLFFTGDPKKGQLEIVAIGYQDP